MTDPSSWHMGVGGWQQVGDSRDCHPVLVWVFFVRYRNDFWLCPLRSITQAKHALFVFMNVEPIRRSSGWWRSDEKIEALKWKRRRFVACAFAKTSVASCSWIGTRWGRFETGFRPSRIATNFERLAAGKSPIRHLSNEEEELNQLQCSLCSE